MTRPKFRLIRYTTDRPAPIRYNDSRQVSDSPYPIPLRLKNSQVRRIGRQIPVVETASHLGQWLCGGGTTTNDTVDPIALYRTRDEAFDALYCDTVEGPFQVARALPNRDAPDRSKPIHEASNPGEDWRAAQITLSSAPPLHPGRSIRWVFSGASPRAEPRELRRIERRQSHSKIQC